MTNLINDDVLFFTAGDGLELRSRKSVTEESETVECRLRSLNTQITELRVMIDELRPKKRKRKVTIKSNKKACL